MRYAEADPTVFALYPEPPVMDIRLEDAFCPVVGV